MSFRRPSRRRARVLATTLVALAAMATSLLLSAGPAAAAEAVPAPVRPHGEHVVRVTAHSITVALPRLAHATHYRLYAATTRNDVTVARIRHAHASAVATAPRLTIRGLRYTTAPYWYRVKAWNAKHYRWGLTVRSVALRPGPPTTVRVTATRRGTWLTWHGTATGFTVAQATDRAMRTGRRTYTLRGTTTQFTPYGTTPGRTYWFRVRRTNHDTASPWSTPVRARVRAHLQPVRLMTYNVLTSAADGQRTTGERIAPWSKRRAGVAALIRGATPDVVCLQEAGGWVGSPQGYGGTRQADDLAHLLGSYTLARTETPPTEHHYFRTGSYLLYRTSVYRAVGTGGHWFLGDNRVAAYQVLQRRSTGATVLAVSVHLNFGNGRAADDVRAAETRSLLSQAGRLAAAKGVPVVYAGDFNSVLNRNHVYDGAGDVMRAHRVADAQSVAQSRPNERFNSANLYLRTPPEVGQSIDYVFAPAGVAVRSREVVLRLSRGRFRGVIPSDHNPVLVRAAFPY
ncbi:Metal-dependent hydrolase, endonuclease/exonuclease/phosphatase family [Jatrophihabitans endophyticus]|uniref:Metal-dependent hydrolase, endonuclease/exonuclease/phosphatase family n=1 Tax=Jatrophihabitans endophyticus TaxID=1206085 RepID=A0A1M5GT24_9ACTN|nr:endonuclease/exonuclease/phosphatase family protein [Jatrophihabitans endophyticus]SHG06940.1 Metal-dependent hydrolase, endonuclease/exonuclease/phosphatase family [Jatrophihabitans endophyticus]